MKALSVREPWAGLICSGRKTIETRTRRTHYRGDVLICASAKPVSELSGKALCIVRIVDCRPMTTEDADAACIEKYPGAWAWILEDIRPVCPFPVRGKLGLFELNLSPGSLLPLPYPVLAQHIQSQPLSV